jgi:hypothetical protein
MTIVASNREATAAVIPAKAQYAVLAVDDTRMGAGLSPRAP